MKQAPQVEPSPRVEAWVGSQGPAVGKPTTELVWGRPSGRDCAWLVDLATGS